MLAHRYQLWPSAWGGIIDPNHPIEKRYVGITTLAKRDPLSAYEVFNELVAMRLGQLAGLAVPAGVVIEKDGIWFASCHVLAAGGELPPCDLDRFCIEKPKDACGVMTFDGWIANSDRHDENIWYDYYTDKYVIFDHGQSLLGSSGLVRLKSNIDRLGIRYDAPCLADYVNSFSTFDYWHQKINEIPRQTIMDTVSEAASVGVDLALAQKCGNWLLDRRLDLPHLFADKLNTFPRLQRTLLDPFGGDYVLFPSYCI